jgi:hypothetical protein
MQQHVLPEGLRPSRVRLPRNLILLISSTPPFRDTSRNKATRRQLRALENSFRRSDMSGWCSLAGKPTSSGDDVL